MTDDTKLSRRDFFWVSRALMRGKVLRQDAYQPKNSMFNYLPDMTINRMVALMKQWGYRPATLGDLLAYLEKNPGEDLKKSPITALGSIHFKYTEGRYVSVSDTYSLGSSDKTADDWVRCSNHRFLAVRD